MLLQNGKTALHKAAIGGHVEVTNTILSHYPSLTTKTDIVSEQLNHEHMDMTNIYKQIKNK